MSSFQDIVKAFNVYDLDSDGIPEIEFLQFLSFENPQEPVGTFQKFVIVLVEQRLLGAIPGSRYSSADLLQRLQRLKNDLLSEGYQARFLEMRTYSGPVHQDGKTLLAIREFFKQVRSNFFGFCGAILIGSFPESMIIRTWPDWRTLENPEEIKELGKTIPAGTKVYNIGLGIHAYRSEIVLSDLNGNWRNLYNQQHPSMHGCVFVPASEEVLPDNKVLLTCATGNYSISQNFYQDFFWIRDDEWQEISRTSTEIKVIITLKLQDPELNQADRTQPNTITRPEINVSRINARSIAVSPDPRLIDLNGKPKRCPITSGVSTDMLKWIRDPNLERTLLIEYFDRNHAFRSGRYSNENLRLSKITYELGLYAVNQGLDGINVPDKDREDVFDASLKDMAKWLKKSQTIRGVGTHASDVASNFRNDSDYVSLEVEAGGNPWRWVQRNGEHVPSFDGHYTADLHFYRTIWENKITQGICPSFFLHCGCDVNTPKNADVTPYNSATYGLGQNAECVLFYANALAVISRSKMFNDGPSGFGYGFGSSDDATFGDGWMQHFQTESMDTELAKKRTERKKSSFWSVIGDWTLRKYYMCEAKTAHFRLRYAYNPNEPISHADETVQFNGEIIGHCHANGDAEIFLENKFSTVGNLPSVPLTIHRIAVWLEYFYSLCSGAPYLTRHVMAQKMAVIVIGKGKFGTASNNSIPTIGIDFPATAEETAGICLKTLLTLDLIQYGSWPEWIFPAFVSRTTLVQTPTLVFPGEYADFSGILRPCQWMTAYDAIWNTTSGNRRLLQIDINKSLHPQMTTNVFVMFNENSMKDIILTVSGQTNQGTTVEIQIQMQSSPDHLYYYGSFQKQNSWRDYVSLKLKIKGTRAWQSNVLKTLIGDVMDSNPATVASVDDSKAALSFLNIETGMDEKHTFTMGPSSKYSFVASLPPDELDRVQSNNTFTAATPVVLNIPENPHKTGVLNKVEKVFENLNLHDQQDIDYFNINIQSPQYDDSNEANRPRTGGTNSYWGITYTHLPPSLSYKVNPADLHCIDVDIYKGDSLNKALFAGDARSAEYTIDSPARVLGSKQCYLVMKNYDYASQGAFGYSLHITYSSAYDSVDVNTHAPGYTEGTITQKRLILDQLYSRIDKPRPPDYREGIIHINDLSSFIKGFEEFLTNPQIIAAVSQQKNKRAAAEGLHFLGNIAETFGRYSDSERLYRKSAIQFESIRDNQGVRDSLGSLKLQYEKLGKITELNKTKAEIGNLKKIIVRPIR